MRTSIDFPDELFRHLKASAALQGLSLRDHVLTLIERGMQPSAAASSAQNDPKPVPQIPKLPAHYQINFPPKLMSSAGINEFLDRQELENYLNVVKHGRSSGLLPGHSAGNKP